MVNPDSGKGDLVSLYQGQFWLPASNMNTTLDLFIHYALVESRLKPGVIGPANDCEKVLSFSLACPVNKHALVLWARG